MTFFRAKRGGSLWCRLRQATLIGRAMPLEGQAGLAFSVSLKNFVFWSRQWGPPHSAPLQSSQSEESVRNDNACPHGNFSRIENLIFVIFEIG